MQTAGVVFPVPILLLIPAREYLLPRIFGRRNLAALDPAPFEDEHSRPKKGQTQHIGPDIGNGAVDGTGASNSSLGQEMKATPEKEGSTELRDVELQS